MKTFYEYIGLAAVTFLNLFVFAKPILPLLKSLKAKKGNSDDKVTDQITDQNELDKETITNEQPNIESRKPNLAHRYISSNMFQEIQILTQSSY